MSENQKAVNFLKCIQELAIAMELEYVKNRNISKKSVDKMLERC